MTTAPDKAPRSCALFERPTANYVVPDEVIGGILADPAQPLARIAKIIPPEASVLDVGCGNGNLGRVLKRAGRTAAIDGVEPNGFAANLAREHYRQVYESGIAELIADGTLGDYDFLILADVIEHVPNPFDFLSGIAPLVQRGTRVLLSVPNVSFGAVRLSLLNGYFDYVDSGLLEKTHLRFLTLKTLLQLFSDLGWGVEKVVRLQRSFFNVEFDRKTIAAEESVLRRLAADQEARTYQHLFMVSARSDVAPQYEEYGASEADIMAQIPDAAIIPEGDGRPFPRPSLLGKLLGR
ncbi:class I SAM-dependent methyltransferase [Bosea sp. RAF48]|uniref:class I SAM-dependent methyltransferase n=1 Tax=Bosea sp. RAF48 TaxID=3237480 RepID=UPI003F908B62